MDLSSVDIYTAIDIFLLLLIGVGPKIALVPFIELTDGMSDETKARVARQMLKTAASVSIVLVLLGEVLRKLLHFSTGALAIAGGIVLLIIAVSMILQSKEAKIEAPEVDDPMRLAVYPLAVPYLLNPVGIVVLVTASGEADSVGLLALVLGALALVLLLDVVVFRWANRVSDHLDASRMMVTEKVFGFLLAALAVQLALNGLVDAGVIQLGDH